MTAFTTSQIPAYVNTIERLAAWSAAALAEINPSASVTIQPGVSELACQSNPFRFANDAANPNRLAIILYLPLAATYRSAAPHRGVNEISATALPASYTTA